ncbi:hypothetical protein IFR05_012319 [Cadophora sp. M221]|nr:hypothetical protein IFR05_012319 [Cadophora sp. M221]
MASFIDLPYELQYEIIVQAMMVRLTKQAGSSRAMRLKLVSKTVASMVHDAILSSHVIDDNLKRGKFAQALPPASVYKFFLKNPIAWSDGQTVYLIARELFDEMSMSGEDTYSSLVGSLILLSFRQLSKTFCPAPFYFGYDVKNIPVGDFSTRQGTASLLTLLAAAAYMNYIPVARRLIEMRVVPWHKCTWLGRPSVAAALQGNNEILKMFLETESDPTAPIKRSALYAAIEQGHVSTVDLILDPQWGHNWISLWNEKKECSTDTLEYGILKALEKNSSVAMFTRASELLADYPAGYAYNPESRRNRQTSHSPHRMVKGSAHFLACTAGISATSLSRHILDLGAPTSNTGGGSATPLWMATKTGTIETVSLLLERGAKANDYQSGWARSALSNALLRGDLEMVKLLVHYKADITRGITFPSHGYPPIIIAMQLEHTPMFRFLLEQGADLHSKPVARLAFTIVAKEGLESMARLMLDEGLVPTDRCVSDAIASGHVELAEMLRGHVRRPDSTAFEETSEVSWLDFEGSY